mmetsp:Transcript_12266/g.11896  ORF Transcript_12266/g.11896 Transcript_12266/m.11896 type:complete len:524 (+) Transcript_12266:206-1777(+)|eukprot:CAMPEP_0119034352 /NCGR_PEP_ID=MMETSP1177-20130426/1339_1 /TAXON_ID=2985 /ORGANISM="Ochromonas sp, Strain CCMP1899" /LENGTH=523 /DNA_ID=CAMNT_0006991721 /DNA_START=103 /DNA_END=1674 /DNA_ORIENTATION=-
MTSAISRGASIDSDLDRRGSSSSPLPIRNKRVQSPLLCGRLKSFEQLDISEMDEMKVAFSSPNEPLKNRIESVKLNLESVNTPPLIKKAAAPASARGMPLSTPIIDRVSSQHEPPSPISSVLTSTPLRSNTPPSPNISLPTVPSPSISTPTSLKVATTPSSGSAKRIAAAPVSVRSTNKPPPLKIVQRESIDASDLDSNTANYHGDYTESTPRYSWPGGKGSPHSRTDSVSPHARAGSPTLEILGSSSKKKMLAMNNKSAQRVSESSLDLSEGSIRPLSSSSVSSISDLNGRNLRPVESVMKPELITSEKKNAFVSSLWNFSNDFSLSGSVTSDSELSEKNEGFLSEKSEITLSPRRASTPGEITLSPRSIQEPSNSDRNITDTAIVLKKTDLKDTSLKVALDIDPLHDSLRGNLSIDMMNTARSEDPPRRRRRSTRKLNRSNSLPGFRSDSICVSESENSTIEPPPPGHKDRSTVQTVGRSTSLPITEHKPTFISSLWDLSSETSDHEKDLIKSWGKSTDNS